MKAQNYNPIKRTNFPKAEFFDVFGMAAFAFITIISIWGIKTQKSFPKWSLTILLIIGILGFIIDAYIVYMTYLRK